MLYCHLWPVSLCQVFKHYVIKAILWKTLLNIKYLFWSYVYRTVHHLDSWIKLDQLMSLALYFAAQHVSNVSTSILRSLRLICCVISCFVLLWYDVCWCYGVVRLGWCAPGPPSFTRFLDHTQRRTTVARTALDEWSARRKDLYLTDIHTQVGFEPTISTGERSQT